LEANQGRLDYIALRLEVERDYSRYIRINKGSSLSPPSSIGRGRALHQRGQGSALNLTWFRVGMNNLKCGDLFVKHIRDEHMARGMGDTELEPSPYHDNLSYSRYPTECIEEFYLSV
jgi:hypothetical protein